MENITGNCMEMIMKKRDAKSFYFYEKWQKNQHPLLAVLVLRKSMLRGFGLTSLPGFAEAVQEKLNEIE